MNDEVDEAVEEGKDKFLARITWFVLSLVGSGFMLYLGWLGVEALENRQFRLSGDRYTQPDASRDRENVAKQFSALPTPDVRKALADLQADVKANSSEITRLKTIVERIDERTR